MNRNVNENINENDNIYPNTEVASNVDNNKVLNNLCMACHKYYFGDPNYYINYAAKTNGYAGKTVYLSPVERITFRGLAARKLKSKLDHKESLKTMQFFYKKR